MIERGPLRDENGVLRCLSDLISPVHAQDRLGAGPGGTCVNVGWVKEPSNTPYHDITK